MPSHRSALVPLSFRSVLQSEAPLQSQNAGLIHPKWAVKHGWTVQLGGWVPQNERWTIQQIQEIQVWPSQNDGLNPPTIDFPCPVFFSKRFGVHFSTWSRHPRRFPWIYLWCPKPTDPWQMGWWDAPDAPGQWWIAVQLRLKIFNIPEVRKSYSTIALVYQTKG